MTENPMDDISFIPVWQSASAAVERDVMALWTALGVLPPGVKAEERIKELVAVAYAGDSIVGVLTAQFLMHPPLRQRFAFLRSLTHPDYGGRDVSRRLIVCADEALSKWAIAHPGEKLAGLAAIYENPLPQSKPIERVGLILVGYTPDGQQVRVKWFEHFRLH